jgi:hypothetical protein
MSEVITDKLTGRATAGDVTITGEGGTGTMQLQNGVLKAWRKYTTVTTTANTDSFNFSSITDNGTGDTSHGFTNNMNNSTYTIMHNTQFSTFSGHYSGGALTTSSFRTGVYNASNSAVDVEHNFVHNAGDLA